MIVETHWEGIDGARSALARWTITARGRVSEAVHDSATDMATLIASEAPVDTGALADSVTVDHEVDSFDSWGAATVYTNVIYARRINFGFHGADSLGRVYAQEANPFWDTGFNAAAPGFESRVRAALLA